MWLAGQKLRFFSLQDQTSSPAPAKHSQQLALEAESNVEWLSSSPAPRFPQKIETDEIILLLLLAPAIMQSICLNYRLQQLFVLFFFQMEGKSSLLRGTVAGAPVKPCVVAFCRDGERLSKCVQSAARFVRVTPWHPHVILMSWLLSSVPFPLF